MPQNAAISLDVRDFAGDGYTQATFNTNSPNPNNLTYYYKYSGGTDGNGNVVEHGRGAVDITLTLNSDLRYQISGLGDGGNNTQLSYTVNDATHATIHDVNNTVEDDYYNVLIRDTQNSNADFWCDPRVTNEN